MRNLLPLQESAAFNEVEDELKSLFIQLWQELLYERAAQVNVYGAPFLGDKDLVVRVLKQAGIANFDTTNLTHDSAKYLLYAALHRNQKRGKWLLETFIKCTWGSDFRVDQLWQKKDDEYPTNLKIEEDINNSGESLDDYYLTSRLRVDFGANGKVFPNEIRESTRGVLPARLFVAQVVRSAAIKDPIVIGIGMVGTIYRRVVLQDNQVYTSSKGVGLVGTVYRKVILDYAFQIVE